MRNRSESTQKKLNRAYVNRQSTPPNRYAPKILQARNTIMKGANMALFIDAYGK